MAHFCFLALDYPTPEGGGGVGNQAQLLGRYLARRGHAVSVITLVDSSGRRHWLDEGVEVFAAKSGSWHWYFNRLPIIGRILGLAIREVEYSIAAWRTLQEIHSRHPIDLVEGSETGCLLAASRLSKTPLVIRLHGEVYSFYKHTPGLRLSFDLRLSRWLQRVAIRRADALVSPSKRHAREVQGEIHHLKSEIRVIPNAIDINAFPSGSGKVDQDVPLMVLYSGRLEKRKGVDLLLKAAGIVIDQMPQVRFCFAGGPHISLDESTLNQLITENHLEKSVDFLGHVPWDDLLMIYRKAALFALPSFYETFGIVALEAMAAGTPVVGWRAGALHEVVCDRITGLLVAPGDVMCLADAILLLLQDEEKRREMGLAAREWVESFDISRLGSENLSFYREVLDHDV